MSINASFMPCEGIFWFLEDGGVSGVVRGEEAIYALWVAERHD